MREIKFRAWDPINNEFTYWGFGDVNGTGAHWTAPQFAQDRRVNYIHEQFTGIQDANGVDIYEGDIVQWSYEDSGGRSFIGLVVAGPSFEIIIDDWGVTHYSNGFAIQFVDGSGYKSFDGRPLTVIGNIHEHPNLLEES